MHILVTNDDGIESPGLFALKQALDPLGDVSVIAPDGNRSATARSITIRRPLEVRRGPLPDGSSGTRPTGRPSTVCGSRCSDCLAATPDIIVSGINHGFNLGDDVTYAGTVAAAFEGVLLGWPAIAVSQQSTNREHWDTGDRGVRLPCGRAFVAGLVPIAMRERFPRHVLLNVNAPGVEAHEVDGAPSHGSAGASTTTAGTDGGRRGRTRSVPIYGDNPRHHPEEAPDFAAIEAGAIASRHFTSTSPTSAGWSSSTADALDELLGETARTA